METRAEILMWLRDKIAYDLTLKIDRSGNDGGAFRDGWLAALEHVADALDEDCVTCS